MKGLHYVGYPVEFLLAQEQPHGLIMALYRIGIWHERTVLRCARVLMDSYGPGIPAPLVHRRYQQRNQLDMYSKGANEEMTMMGTIQMGQVLEIFKKDDSCDIAKNIVSNMKTDFLQLVDHPNHYHDLPGIKHDKYLVFDNMTGEVEVGFLRHNSTRTERYNNENWAQITEKERASYWVDHMRRTARSNKQRTIVFNCFNLFVFLNSNRKSLLLFSL